MNPIIKLVEEEEELEEFLELAYEIFPGANIEVEDDDFVFLAYADEGNAVGFIHYGERKDHYALKGFGVKSALRRQGIGKMLLETSTEELIGKPIYLATESTNPAINLYTRSGFFIEEFGGRSLLVKRELN